MQKKKKQKLNGEIEWPEVWSFTVYYEAQASKSLHYALLSPMKSAHKCQLASSSLITKIKQSWPLHFICWASQILHSIWAYTGRNHFAEHWDAAIYGLKSGNKPPKTRLLTSGRHESLHKQFYAIKMMASLLFKTSVSQVVYSGPVLISVQGITLCWGRLGEKTVNAWPHRTADIKATVLCFCSHGAGGSTKFISIP